jgi:hypothetical protein
MAKQKSIKLSIPTPCSESWENMTPNEQGRHCDSCNKTVIDFSLFSDKQLIEFFSTLTGKICGRLNPMQVERELIYVEQKNHFLYKLLFGTALTFGFVGSANGSYNPNQKPLMEQYMGVENSKGKEDLPQDTGKHLIVKVIDDSTGEALPFAAVALYQDNRLAIGNYSDTSGKADISLKNYGTYYITCSYPGFNNYNQYTVIDKNNQKITIRLNQRGIKFLPLDIIVGFVTPTVDPQKNNYIQHINPKTLPELTPVNLDTTKHK